MRKINILWADDEIDLLKPHIIFLEEKGYQVQTTTNGNEAIEALDQTPADIVFLDENMPGLSGMETLDRIKKKDPNLPVVIITKNEDESLMEDAIGSRIAGYLLKPVNPKQILLLLKKTLDESRLVSEKTTMSYQQEFRSIGMTLGDRLNQEEWKALYQKFTFWDLELQQSDQNDMNEILQHQKQEANTLFSKYIEKNYLDWLNQPDKDTPIMSHTLLQKSVFPLLKQGKKIFLVLIDNLRYDQWKMLNPLLGQQFRLEEETMYYSILPTATQYARNALFAGLMPSEISKKYPNYWVDEQDEGSKNRFEAELLQEHLKRFGLNIKSSYHKIVNLQAGKKLSENLQNLKDNQLNVIVFNFVDMLSHARTDMEVIRELADDEAAYRSLTLSWFEHSPLRDIFRQLAQGDWADVKTVITSDHGTIRVQEPSKVVGDKNTSTNLRYKHGKNLKYEDSEVFAIERPEDAFLPRTNVSSKYIFAKDQKFFAYPNNYNYYVNFYRNTFQHGGISLEEVLVPFVMMSAK